MTWGVQLRRSPGLRAKCGLQGPGVGPPPCPGFLLVPVLSLGACDTEKGLINACLSVSGSTWHPALPPALQLLPLPGFSPAVEGNLRVSEKTWFESLLLSSQAVWPGMSSLTSLSSVSSGKWDPQCGMG